MSSHLPPPLPPSYPGSYSSNPVTSWDLDRTSAAKTRLAMKAKRSEPSVGTGTIVVTLAVIIGAITCVHLWVNTPRPQSVPAVRMEKEAETTPAKFTQAEVKKRIELWNDYTALAVRLYPDAAKADSKLSLRATAIQKRLKDAGDPMAEDILSGVFCIHEAAKELGIKPDEGKENELASYKARSEAVARMEQARNDREISAANEDIQALKNKLAEAQRDLAASKESELQLINVVYERNQQLEAGSAAYNALVQKWNSIAPSTRINNPYYQAWKRSGSSDPDPEGGTTFVLPMGGGNYITNGGGVYNVNGNTVTRLNR